MINNFHSRFKIIKRHETELKWIKSLQTSFPLGFNDNIYLFTTMVIFLKCQILTCFLSWKRKSRSRGLRLKGN